MASSQIWCPKRWTSVSENKWSARWTVLALKGVLLVTATLNSIFALGVFNFCSTMGKTRNVSMLCQHQTQNKQPHIVMKSDMSTLFFKSLCQGTPKDKMCWATIFYFEICTYGLPPKLYVTQHHRNILFFSNMRSFHFYFIVLFYICFKCYLTDFGNVSVSWLGRESRFCDSKFQ